MKHTVLSDTGEANVKHVCEANVKHFCNNIRNSANGTLSPDISMYENSVQALPKVAPKMSDLTAKDISPQGVSMDVNLPDRSLDGQPIGSAKSISAPGVEDKCSNLADSGSALLSDVTLEQGEGHDTSNMKGELRPIFDINYTGVGDKFVNSISI